MDVGGALTRRRKVQRVHVCSAGQTGSGSGQRSGLVRIWVDPDQRLANVQKAPKGSAESVEAQKRLDEQIARRSHVDHNMNQIVNHMFGDSGAARMLIAVRPEDRPAVDDWDFLKTFVILHDLLVNYFSNP
ncbi:hypothetical protein NL676_007002 [Syzygium grande]|nr:hypothetical protein NL676_007002 [Syzygium grande]